MAYYSEPGALRPPTASVIETVIRALKPRQAGGGTGTAGKVGLLRDPATDTINRKLMSHGKINATYKFFGDNQYEL